MTGVARVDIAVADGEAIVNELAHAFDARPRWVEASEYAQFIVGKAVLQCETSSAAPVVGPYRITFATPQAGQERLVENARLVL
ncbi:MAG: hypothetical protein KatS3mg060_1033 [Dehalococcoidia bacterium]|nr:MAG: hypothetical protein KatS3mg060_1033 [Dehalococcoidia bacterium]